MIQAGSRTISDPMFRAIAVVGILLAILHAVMLGHWGSALLGPVIPWFVPLTYSFMSLSGLSVAVLALGRHRVLRDPASYWIGLGYLLFGIGYLFFILAWPGILPNGNSVFGHLANTPAWLGVCSTSAMAVCFISAVSVDWPGPTNLLGTRWLGSVLAAVVFMTVLSCCIIKFEVYLPVLVGHDGAFSPLLSAWHVFMAMVLGAGAVLSAIRYRRTGDSLLGYLTLTEMVVAFSGLSGLFGANRWSLVYSIDRILSCAAVVAMIFGLLLQYVGLFRREQEKTQDLARAQAAAHLGNWRWHLRTNQVFWSEELYRIFGVDPHSFVPSNEAANALIHPDDRAKHTEFVQIALTGKTVEPFDCRIVRPNGEERIVVASGFAVQFDEAQMPKLLFGTVLDVTERRLAERKVEESELRYRELSQQLEVRVQQRTAQLQLANKELEAFTYSVSHDLRAPLRTLDGFSQALLQSADGLDGKARHYLERIRAAAQRMRSLTDGFLQLSRMSRSELQTNEVDITALAQSMIEELRDAEPDRAVEVHIDPGMTVTGDPRLLGAALQNLIGNAWKFSAGRNPAVIDIGRVNHGSQATFYVRDNGAGFDMEHAQKLFTPFHRMHSDSQFPGTGIGLATVQRIIGRHEGRIWAEAAPDAGATFYFEIPERHSQVAKPRNGQ